MQRGLLRGDVRRRLGRSTGVDGRGGRDLGLVGLVLVGRRNLGGGGRLGHDGGLRARRGGRYRDRGARADRDRRGRAGRLAVAARRAHGLRGPDRAGALRRGGGPGERRLGVRHGLRLDLARALGSAPRPIAQPLELARLGEVEHCEDGQSEKRGESDISAVLLDLVLYREREDQTMEPSGRF